MVSLLHETRCKTGWTGAINAKVCATKSHQNFFAANPPNPTHWTLNSCIGLFHTVWVHCGFVSLLHETRCKTGWIGAINEEVRATKSHQSFSQWTHPIHPHWTLNSRIGAFCSVWVHFGLFRYCTKLDAKWAVMVELMHKFVAWNRIGSFRNECTRYTQLDPKLLFWCVS